MARLTKRQIKEDKFVSSLLKSQEYFSQHKSQIILILLGVLVAVLIVIFLVTSSRQARERAANEYGAANMYIREFYGTYERDANQDGVPDGSLDSALTILKNARTEFEEVLRKHGGSKQAKFATFYLASIYFQLSEFEKAEDHYQRFLDKYFIDKNFEASAKSGIAGCRESMGDLESAGKMYLEVAQNYPDFSQRVDILYKATINLAKAGLKEEAREAFALLEEVPAARNRINDAREYLYEMKILDPFNYEPD